MVKKNKKGTISRRKQSAKVATSKNAMSFVRRNKVTVRDIKTNQAEQMVFFMCDYCDYGTATKKMLQNHVSLRHRQEHKMHKYAGKEPVLCEYCEYSCYSKIALFHHKKVKHREHTVNPKKPVICLEEGCGFECSKLANLRSHLQDVHNFELHCETLYFTSLQEFEHWMLQVEKDHICRFVAYSQSSNKTPTRYYRCNRSGTFVSKGSGKRNLKSQGTCKTGIICTATIKRTLNDDGTVTAVAHLSHYGHELEVGHLRLQPDEKMELQNKLMMGVPVERIYEDCVSSVDKTQRINVIRKDDLYNINKSLRKFNQMVKEEPKDPIMELKLHNIETIKKRAAVMMRNINDNSLDACDENILDAILNNINQNIALLKLSGYSDNLPSESESDSEDSHHELTLLGDESLY